MSSSDNLMLVGVGASAGGVEALRQFFEQMPADAGLAFVVVLHLAPEHESRLAEVLQAKTRMPVEQVTEPVRVEANHVYVVPPDHDLYMADGQIRLEERTREEGGRHAPVDLFFRTLADSYRERAVAVVLSGANTDGSVGVTRVKELGGVSIAQDPAEAEYGAMPRGALETGAVDFVLPVAAMPEKLVSLRRNAERIQLPPVEQPVPGADEDALREVLGLLRVRTRHDFTGYKRSTLLRRLERRMQVTETEDLRAYLSYVREQPEELQRLLSDLLISVTNFFRDREAFAQLESEVVPHLFGGKGPDEQVRVWVAGCATGEEAYSLAMLLIEHAERLPRPPAVQVFASDIDEAALQRTREGLYPEAIATDVSPERLKRFFTREGQRYRVKRELRETVLITAHNVLRDPPFSKLDLVSCRNLLIYVNRQTQERVLEIFHFALRPGGHLFLGSSETAEALPDLFAPVDKKHRVFRRLDMSPNFRGAPALPVAGRWEARPASAPQTPPPPGAGAEPSTFGELHYRTLEALAPPSVLVNADYDIVHASESAGRFLRFAGGEPSRNLLKVAHPDLQMELRSLLLRGEQGGGASRDVTVNLDGGQRVVRVGVRRVASTRTAPGFLLVVFEELVGPAAPQQRQAQGDGAGPEPGAGEGLEPVVRQLEEELQRTREQLRATVEMSETQAEEFKAANEELQAMNEELRSASEELETGKEELQSVNEELTTVNAELREKVEEVSRTSSDLQNLLVATQIATLFLDRNLRIKRYTPGVQELFNLIPGDVGRPLSDLTHRLDYDRLAADAEEVLRTLHSIEREAGSREGRFFLVRLMPYRTTDDRIEGVVVTFVDITERKRAEEALRESEERQAFLLALGDAMRSQSSAIGIVEAAGRLLGERLSPSRVLFAEFDETNGFVHVFHAWLADGAEPFPAVVRQEDFAGPVLNDLRAGRTLRVDDAGDPPFARPDLAALTEVGIKAALSVPLIIGGRLMATLSVHQHAARHWTDAEVALLEEVAERLWADLVRARSEEALRKSEEKFRKLFDSIDEGLAIVEMIYGEDGEIVDMIYRQVNRAFERHGGVHNVVGRSIFDVIPGVEDYWLDAYKQVAKTGEPVRQENYQQNVDRWFDVYFSRVDDSGRFVATVFNDITERKRREANLAFLTNLMSDFAPLSTPEEIIEMAGKRLAEHLDLSRYLFVEIHPEAGTCTYLLPSRPDGRLEISGSFILADYHTVEENRLLSAGHSMVVNDVRDGTRTPEQIAAFEAFDIASIVNTPCISNGRWVFDLGVTRSKPSVWREDEIELLREISARVWLRIERARAEAALRASEEKYRTLFDSMDEGFVLVEVITDESGRAIDALYLEGNPAASRLTGVPDYTNRRWSEVVPGAEPYWLEIYDRVARTGEGERSEQYLAPLGRWYDLYVFPVGQAAPGGDRRRVAVLFQDITERKRAEEALRASEEFNRSIVAGSRDCLKTLDPEGTLLWMSDEGQRLLCIEDVRPLLGKSWLDFWGGEERAAAESAVRAAAAGESAQFVGLFTLSDGCVKWFDVVVSPILGAGGQPERLLAASRDVTERRLAEEALRESEERLQKAISIETVGVLFFDEGGRFTDCNEAFTRMSGYTREEMSSGGLGWEDLTPPEWMGRSREAIAELKATGRISPYEKEYFRKDGSRFWGLFAGSRISDGETVEYVVDVSARRRAEEAMRASEERLRLVAESVHDYAIFTTDSEGRVTSWNEGALRIKGYTAGEVIGQPAAIFYTEEDVAAGKPAAQMEAALATGRSEDEGWRVRKGGSLFWADEVMTPLRSGDGQLLGFTKVCRDLTERRRAEEALRASEERLRLVVESVEDYAILTTDTEGRILSWNPGAERAFGYAAEEAVGQHVSIIFTPEDREHGVPEEEMRQAREEGRALDERWHLSKRGVRFYASGVTTPLRDGGRLVGYVKIARDQTERKQMEEALRRAHDELEERVRERTRELQETAGELLVEIKERAQAEERVRALLRQLVTVQEEERRRIARELHDTLGQQLAALHLSIDMIKKESEGRARLREHIERTQSIFDGLNSDIDFLAWELRPAALDQLGLDAALQTFVREWSGHFGVEAHYHGLGPDAPRLAPEVETNLYRILQEALQNVHKHAGASRVSVQLQQRDGRAVLIVEDNGRGYDADAEEAAGTNKGMGVTNMRERAALLGGELEIESAPGAGVTIYVRVPAGGPEAGGTET